MEGLLQKHPTETGSESYRLPFGDNGVLDFYLDLLAEDVNEHAWTLNALRLVGNSCADLGSYHDGVPTYGY